MAKPSGRSFRDDETERSFRVYKSKGGAWGPKTWWQNKGRRLRDKRRYGYPVAEDEPYAGTDVEVPFLKGPVSSKRNYSRWD